MNSPIKHTLLNSKDELTTLIKEKSILHWDDLIYFIQQLPYGRNQNREDFSLVLIENKGTCSSKHAFLKKIADLNQIEEVALVLVMYKMNHLNTPKIGNIIAENGLSYIPEAHCYLKIGNKRFDITTPNANIENLYKDIIEEIEIQPEQVNTFKVEFHQTYLKKWIKETPILLHFDEVWKIREKCIKKLEER